MMTVLQTCHEDETLYKNAKRFEPERILINGLLNLKLDTSMPFGAGKRLCAGETFARNTVFLLVTTVLQNFAISIPAGQQFPSPDAETLSTGLGKTPPDFWVKFDAT